MGTVYTIARSIGTRSAVLFVLGAGTAACKGDDTDPPVETDAETDAPADTDVAADTDMPGDPRPFAVTFTGAVNTTLSFDDATCTVRATQFRVVWRGTGHSVVLIGETVGQYAGPGTYDQSLPNTRAKFQEEAYGAGYGFFQTEPTQGDTFLLDVQHVDDDPYAAEHRAWGEFTVGGMHGTDGALTLSPTVIPIWCPTIN